MKEKGPEEYNKYIAGPEAEKLRRWGIEVGDNGMLLAARWRSGIFSLLFSRVAVIAVLLILQILLTLAVWGLFGTLLTKISSYGVQIFEAVIMIYLINTDMDATGKITWMLVMAILPLFGVLLYTWTRTEVGHRRIAARIAESTDLSRGKLDQDPGVLTRLKRTDRDSASIANYTIRAGNFPVYENTKVTYFPSGEEKLEEMLRRLEKAEKFIFLEYFIIQEGYMWGKILEILSRKVQEGVEVRVVFDGTCLLTKVPADYHERLRRVGIQCRVWAPLRPIVTSTYNYRDHRKILVIDGEVAFNGGINLADEYIGRTKPFGEWKDAAVMLEGEAVGSFTLMFLTMWHAASDRPEKLFQDKKLNPEDREAAAQGSPDEENPYRKYFPEQIPVPRGSGGFVLPYGDSPLDEYKVGEMVYMDILNTAEDYVYITTPYLILDGELETALKFAAERGVDVRLIVPGIPDKKAVYLLAKSTFPTLIRSGVKIYTYTPGFVHAKIFVSDHRKAVVGTINLDYRSLYHHFECATYMVDTSCIAEIHQDYLRTLEDCAEVTLETIRKEGILTRMTGAVMKMFAPML